MRNCGRYFGKSDNVDADDAGEPRRMADNRVVELSRLPGLDIVESGLRDLAASRDSAAADLVLIGEPRLRRLGFDVPLDRAAGAEHRLYLRLVAEDPRMAHSRYNALIRRLVSFERAAECRGACRLLPL